MSGETELRIAVLGSQGIPARFGGFETFAEQLAVRLVERGYQVTVYCEGDRERQAPTYRGVQLRYVHTPKIVGLRSIWSDLVAISRCLRGYDRVYMLGYHAAFTFLLPRLLGVDFWVNMDGLEWRRTKWSRAARIYLRFSEALAAHFARHLIADSGAIADHLAAAYPACAHKIRVIPYGVDVPPETGPQRLGQWGLEPGRYDLVVCRLEPENHVLEVIQGHTASRTDHVLAIVGDHLGPSKYVAALRQEAAPRVRFFGSIYDAERLVALRQHCRVYFHGHSVGGTNPSLLEAMACGNRVIAHDNPFNREVLCDLGRYFSDADEITQHINEFERAGPPPELREEMIARVRDRYAWEHIIDLYLDAFSAAPPSV